MNDVARVRLLIKYQGRPTTTIAVGDPLDFKLETQEGRNLLQVGKNLLYFVYKCVKNSRFSDISR